jgi:ABC-type uncharacterized transport system ATPase subunit
MVDDEVWDDSPIERAIDCLAEISVAAEELRGIAGMEDDGLRGFAEVTQQVAQAYRQKLMRKGEEPS